MWLFRYAPVSRDDFTALNWKNLAHRFIPWFGDDEYWRKTLVLPLLPTTGVVIALWEHRNLADCPDDCNPYRAATDQDRRWLRWKAIRTHGRLER